MSNLKITIKDTQTSTREGVSTKTNKPYKMRTQDNVFLELNDEVRRFPLNLDDNVSPYAPGLYSFDPTAVLRVGRYGLEVDGFALIHLTPLPDVDKSTGEVIDKPKMFGTK